MLTEKQRDLLLFIHDLIEKDGVSSSFDEMKDALELRSKSGIHSLITALEERGFIKRLPHRARALEIIRLPEEVGLSDIQTASIRDFPSGKMGQNLRQTPNANYGNQDYSHIANMVEEVSVLGRIAAGTPISAIQHEQDRFAVPKNMLRSGEHFALEVQGDSMINAGIHDGDIVVIQRCDDAPSGEIVVALVDEEEATLKRIRKRGDSVALEAENPAHETRIFGTNRVKVQGKLVGLMRQY